MTVRSLKSLAIILALSVSAVAHAAAIDPSAAATTSPASKGDMAAKPSEHASPSQELQSLKDALPGKKVELGRLHHKWSVVKGRTPGKDELKDFEEKRAQGKATFDDNPYINKKPLSTPGPARAAYFKKLEEIRKDEERIRQLEKELNGL
jgi:hypothetical protein